MVEKSRKKPPGRNSFVPHKVEETGKHTPEWPRCLKNTEIFFPDNLKYIVSSTVIFRRLCKQYLIGLDCLN